MPLKLYWCQTADHHEDWFIIARRARDAIQFFADYEGYDHEEVHAQVALVLPDQFQRDDLRGWPSRETLEACGVEILRWETPRVVEIDGRRYAEGMLEHQIVALTDDLSETLGRGRPNQTTRNRSS